MCVDAVCGAKQASTGVFWGGGGGVMGKKWETSITAYSSPVSVAHLHWDGE